MALPAYSSLSAFLAHREALSGLSSPTTAQRELLQSMEELVARLNARDRMDLESSNARRRERAERALLRILREHEMVSG